MGEKSGPQTVVYRRATVSMHVLVTATRRWRKAISATYHHEDGKRPPPGPGLAVDVGKNARHNGNGSTGKHSAEEPKHKKGRPVGSQGTRHSKEGEGDEGNNGQVAAAKVLAQWAPDDGPKDISYQEDADGEHFLRRRRDAKVTGDVGDGHARQGRPHGRVDDEHGRDDEDKELFGLRAVVLATTRKPPNY